MRKEHSLNVSLRVHWIIKDYKKGLCFEPIMIEKHFVAGFHIEVETKETHYSMLVYLVLQCEFSVTKQTMMFM